MNDDMMRDMIRAAFGAGFDLGSDYPQLSRRDFNKQLERHLREASTSVPSA